MTIDKAYNSWAEHYDLAENKTRDLEKEAARHTLNKYHFKTVIDLGCGTGKNIEWLADKSEEIIGLDFSEKMLLKVREKIKSDKVHFRHADLNKAWDIEDNYADLISCSLTLEHISNLNFIFKEAFGKLKAGGKFFICELHPFKQYQGSKARFESKSGTVVPEVFTHHVSEYLATSFDNGFRLVALKEWFDDDTKAGISRLISFVFEK